MDRYLCRNKDSPQRPRKNIARLYRQGFAEIRVNFRNFLICLVRKKYISKVNSHRGCSGSASPQSSAPAPNHRWPSAKRGAGARESAEGTLCIPVSREPSSRSRARAQSPRCARRTSESSQTSPSSDIRKPAGGERARDQGPTVWRRRRQFRYRDPRFDSKSESCGLVSEYVVSV